MQIQCFMQEQNIYKLFATFFKRISRLSCHLEMFKSKNEKEQSKPHKRYTVAWGVILNEICARAQVGNNQRLVEG
jgi:hypothetical protein